MIRITIRRHSTFVVNDYAAFECSPPLSPARPSPDGNVAPFQIRLFLLSLTMGRPEDKFNVPLKV
jgi:hypothetical protein